MPPPLLSGVKPMPALYQHLIILGIAILGTIAIYYYVRADFARRNRRAVIRNRLDHGTSDYHIK